MSDKNLYHCASFLRLFLQRTVRSLRFYPAHKLTSKMATVSWILVECTRFLIGDKDYLLLAVIAVVII